MPDLKTEIPETFPEPVEGQIYTIEGAEVFTSQVRSYKGVRVTMVDAAGAKLVTALWLREVAGEKSKLGSFVHALTSNTDNWIGKKVKFVSWRDKNRKIEVVQ